DIRPRYGATATMLTEYLRASGRPAIASGLATALLFGIRTDTDSLRRHVTPADVTAYAYLQRSADTGLLRRFEKPSYTARSAHAFGRALTESASDADGLMVASLGELSDDESHVLADLADFGMAIEN